MIYKPLKRFNEPDRSFNETNEDTIRVVQEVERHVLFINDKFLMLRDLIYKENVNIRRILLKITNETSKNFIVMLEAIVITQSIDWSITYRQQRLGSRK